MDDDKIIEQFARTVKQQEIVVENLHFPKVLFAEYRDVLDLVTRQRAEIDRLNKEVDRLSQCVLYHEGHIVDTIKDFAERLHKRVTDVGVHSAIDCVVHEMGVDV